MSRPIEALFDDFRLIVDNVDGVDFVTIPDAKIVELSIQLTSILLERKYNLIREQLNYKPEIINITKPETIEQKSTKRWWD